MIREKIISSSKIKHLEDLKEKLSIDLNEMNGKFETAMKHLNNKSESEKQKLQNSIESQIKSLENKHKDEVEDLQFRLDKMTNEQAEREKYFKKEKEDLQVHITKLQNNDQFKLEAKFNEKNKELITVSNELKTIKDRGTSEQLKNNFTFEMEKKSL